MLSSFQIVFSIQFEKRWKWYSSVFYLSYYLLQVTSYISMHVNLACTFYYWHTHFVNKRDGLYVSLDYIILSDVNIDILHLNDTLYNICLINFNLFDTYFPLISFILLFTFGLLFHEGRWIICLSLSLSDIYRVCNLC